MRTLTPEERHEFSRAFIVTGRMWRNVLGDRLKSAGLTTRLWSALSALAQAPGGISQASLADRSGAEPATLVRTLDLLEQQGLVERRASATDRRVKLLHITSAGRARVKEIDVVADALRLEVMADLGAADVRDAVALFQRLRHRLEAANGAPKLRVVAGGRVSAGADTSERRVAAYARA